MKVAYLDCASGISGDMTLAALVDLGVELEMIQVAIDSLGLPSCRLVKTEVKRHGFRATHIKIEHEPEHAHRHLHHITDMIERSSLSARQKELATRIFTRLGEAEAKVHGTTIRKVHFHEVGAVDSIADIVGSAVAWDLLGVDQIVSSPIPTGGGFIEIAHGRCSVPAPATAELLTGVPLAPSNVEAELTTPTGAAIVATLAQQFGPLPAMTISKIGYGAGTRDLEQQPNLLRIVVGEATSASGASPEGGDGSERVWMLQTNLDDTTGQVIGYCSAKLFEAGALDVVTTPVHMKKNRPGVMISVLCQEADVPHIEAILFRETTTLGIRRWPVRRTTLDRSVRTIETPFGPIDGKVVTAPGENARFLPEYESCRRAAESHKVPLHRVMTAAQRAFEENG